MRANSISLVESAVAPTQAEQTQREAEPDTGSSNRAVGRPWPGPLVRKLQTYDSFFR